MKVQDSAADVAAAVRELAAALKSPEPLPPVRHPGKVYDATGRHVPSRACGPVTALQAFPGLAAQFERVVPEEYLDRRVTGDVNVRCTCGAVTGMLATFTNCAGECGRVFIVAGRAVRVAGPYAPDPEPLRCDVLA